MIPLDPKESSNKYPTTTGGKTNGRLIIPSTNAFPLVLPKARKYPQAIPKGVEIKVAEQATFRESTMADRSWEESDNIAISLAITNIRAM